MTSKAARKDKKPREERGCTPEVVELIASRLEGGVPLAVVCREDGMPGLRTVYDWMAKDEDVRARLEQARDVGEDMIAASCLDIVDEPPAKNSFGSVDSGDVQSRKLRVWTRLQLLAKWNPKRWGDRQEIDHKSTDGSMSPPRQTTVVIVDPKANAGS